MSTDLAGARPLRVWAWMPRSGLGGLQRLAMSLHVELLAQGEQSRLLFTGGDPTRLAREVAGEVAEVERLGRFALMRRLAFERPDVLIHHTGDTHRWLPLLRLLSPRTRHVRLFHQGFGAKRDPLHRLTFAGTAACIFPTALSLERSRTCIPVDDARRHLLPYGVRLPPPPQASDASEAGPWPPLRLTIMSRIDPGKGQVEFVRVLARACASRPGLAGRIRLDIYGGYEAGHPPAVAFHQQLTEAVRDPALEGCAVLRGHTADPGAALRASHWLVFPSTDEFYGLALLEAYGHGVPALCARRGSFTELHGEDRGRFLDLDDPERAAAQIAALLDVDPAAHAAMGRAGRARVEACGSLTGCVSGLRRILHQVAPT